VAAKYEDREASGLPPLWTYYWGFRVDHVLGTAHDLFEVTIELERGTLVRERLTIGPGVGLDGERHDLVILDAEPVSP